MVCKMSDIIRFWKCLHTGHVTVESNIIIDNVNVDGLKNIGQYITILSTTMNENE